MRLRLYTSGSVFSFGKHQGETLDRVRQIDPDYLQFCILKLDHFVLRRVYVEQMLRLNTGLGFSTEAWECLDSKEARYNAQEEHNYRDDHYEPDYSRRDIDRDTFDALTDGQYGDYNDYGGDIDSLRDALGY